MRTSFIRIGFHWLHVVLVATFVGCSSGHPVNIGYAPYKASPLVLCGHQVAIWFDLNPMESRVGGTEPGKDSWADISGAAKLRSERWLNFRCKTEDGKHGTMTFTMQDDPDLGGGKTYQLIDGAIFLVTTVGAEARIEQVNKRVPRIAIEERDGNTYWTKGQVEWEELIRSDPQLAKFSSAAEETAKNLLSKK